MKFGAFLIAMFSIGNFAMASGTYICGVYANIKVTSKDIESRLWKEVLPIEKNEEYIKQVLEEGKISFPLWKDLISERQSETKVRYVRNLSFAFQVDKNSKLSGRITFHMNDGYSVFGESDGRELVVRLEDKDLFFVAGEILKIEMKLKSGEKQPEITSIELRCNLQ